MEFGIESSSGTYIALKIPVKMCATVMLKCRVCRDDDDDDDDGDSETYVGQVVVGAPARPLSSDPLCLLV